MVMPKETEIPADKLMSFDTSKAPPLSRSQPINPEVMPTDKAAEIVPAESGTLFESSEIGVMHDQQKALEIDRREQERSAHDQELADRD